MKISEKIPFDIKTAMKSKDSLKLNTLRMIKSSLDYKKLELKKDELDESDEFAVLKTIVKQRKESIEAFRNAGKEQETKKEESELKIVESFLPKSLSKEEIEKAVDETISETGATSPKEMGKVMKACMEKFQGQMVDGKTVSSIVKEKLTPKEEE